jgi:hypothetical protein
VKVIRVSNYDHEDHRGNQRLVAGPGLSVEEAESACKFMCDDPNRSDEDWFRVVADNHVLYRFEP